MGINERPADLLVKSAGRFVCGLFLGGGQVPVKNWSCYV